MHDDRTIDPRVQPAERPDVTAYDSGAVSAAETWRPLVQPGMYVVGVAGDDIGQVKEVRAGDFLIDCATAARSSSGTPIYLPFERIHAMMGDRITLDVPSSQIDELGSVPAPLGL